MYELTIEVNQDLPTHAIYITLDGKNLRVSVSPRVEAEVLAAALHPHVASAVADAVDGRDGKRPSPE